MKGRIAIVALCAGAALSMATPEDVYVPSTWWAWWGHYVPRNTLAVRRRVVCGSCVWRLWRAPARCCRRQVAQWKRRRYVQRLRRQGA